MGRSDARWVEERPQARGLPDARPVAQRLSDQVAEYLRSRIFKGELKSGDRLVETELSQEMGISRAPIREALVALKRDGLATTQPYRGTVVASYDDHDLEEIRELRLALEDVAARFAAVNDPARAGAVMHERLERMIVAARKGDGPEAALAHIELHRAIGEASGFGRLVGMLDQLSAQSLALWSYAELSPSDLESLARSHQPIIDSIASGDPAQAQAAVRKHVSETSSPVTAALRRWKGQQANPTRKDSLQTEG